MKKIKVGIIGATGYAGVELVRLLALHPQAQIVALSSVSYEGKRISDVYPNLKDICDDVLENEDIIDRCDVIFTSLPHGLSEKFAGKCLDKGVKMIDLGADFRLDSAEEYAKWYNKQYEDEKLHTQSVYCIPELHRAAYKNQPIIGNPGCYPTSIALGLAPAIKYAVDNTVVIDSKSGVTGAGRGLADNTHYPNCNEAFSPYKVASHRHTPEIEQTLSKLAGKKVNVTFVPHLLPVNRGIVSTIYFNVKEAMTAKRLHEIYSEFYKREKFVRVLAPGEIANLRNVKYSNYCDISVHYDEHTQRAVIVSTIDNMVKGAAGQAIQNMNIMFGLEEKCGLEYIPPAF
ncbi:MAG: N-acetyl-gamma-glutamyl-phosphate reductase [Clostridia bacterium]|nr:N-acetyl-gamma-glutamyl-phosphate reductase [Clostridia bacterium]